MITVNDYLARRDTEWMGQIYQFLGLTVGTIQQGLDDRQRKELGERARRYVLDHFEWRLLAGDYLKLYREVGERAS